jgi:fructose-bisphosphate aldolase class II
MRIKEVLAKQVLFALNCDDFLIYRGAIQAIQETNIPAIVQVSPGERDFWGLSRFACLTANESAPIFTNFDHARDLDTVKKVIDHGFSMVHFDGSALEWEENLDLTRQAVEMAYPDGMLVEGEPLPKDTTPKKAAEFVEKTGVDLIAVFVGNKHGMNPEQAEHLDLDQLKEIKQAVGDKVGLTLHGGSGVPRDEIKQAIDLGLINKININTRLRLVYQKALENEMAGYEGKFKVYKLMNPVMEAIKREVIAVLNYE